MTGGRLPAARPKVDVTAKTTRNSKNSTHKGANPDISRNWRLRLAEPEVLPDKVNRPVTDS